MVNSKTNEPVSVVIRFKEKGQKSYDPFIVNNDADGNFSFILPHGKEYDIALEGSKYFKMTDKISLLDTSLKIIALKSYKMEAFLDSGEVFVMNHILFEFGTANLKEESYPEIDNPILHLQEQNKAVIEISGHTDDVRSEEFNLKLSQQRASSVMDYIILKGIRSWRLKAKGYGEQVPISSNDTEEGRFSNRRVQIKLLEEDFSKKYQKKAPLIQHKNKSTVQPASSISVSRRYNPANP